MKWQRARTGQLYWAEDGSGYTWEWEIRWDPEEELLIPQVDSPRKET